MSKKQELIAKMLEMQKRFMEFERAQEHGVDPTDYYLADPGHPLHDYHKQYRDVAMQIVEIAHEEKGSRR